MNLYWREPLWLLLGLLPLLWAGVMWWRQRSQWQQLVDSQLLPWVSVAMPPKHRAQQIALVVGWLLLCVALAGPRTPASVPPSATQTPQTLIALVDLSDSMRVRDGQPDRIGSSVRVLKSWQEQLPMNVQLGLIVFAGRAHVYLPPTHDRHLFAHFLDQLSQLRPSLLGNALDEALTLAKTLTTDAEHTHWVIFSDGDMDSAARQRATQLLKPALHWHWIGVGRDEAGQVLNVRGLPLSIEGRRISSRRDSAWVAQLAAQSSGRYQALERIAQQPPQQVLNLSEPHLNAADAQNILWHEYFGLPLLGGVLLLMLGLQQPPFRLRASLLGLLTLGLGACQPSVTAPEQWLTQGDYTAARESVAEQAGYRARFIEGTACYRLKDYPCAADAFARAAWQASTRQDRASAVFNLGNVYFRLGDFAQAEVLFRDAGLLGADTDKVALNLAYAHDLKQAMRQRRADIAETERRAQWRAAASLPPEGFDQRLADSVNLVRELSGQSPLRRMDVAQLQALLQTGIDRLRESSGNTVGVHQRSWVRSPQSDAPQNTGALFNRLMAIESGLSSLPEQPALLQGQRAW